MAIFFMGSEPEIWTTFSGSASSSANVVVSGENRAGIDVPQGTTAATTFTPLTEGWLHYRYGGPGSTTTSGSSPLEVLFLRNAEGQNFLRMNSAASGSVQTIGFSVLSQAFVTVGNWPAVIDVQWKIAASGGFIRVWVNALNQINFEGNTLPASGAASVSSLSLSGLNYGSNPRSTIWSQFLISDLPTINARVITTPLTVSTPNDWDGTPTNVTGTTLSGLANAIKEQVPEQRIRFNAADLSAIGATEFIGGVNLAASALAEVGTAVPRLGATVFDGTTEVDIGTPQPKGTTFSGTNFLMNTNPVGGGTWTVSSFNSAQFALVAKA